MKTHLISSIAKGSIAEELEIRPGDFLLSVNGEEVGDVFDYRDFIQNEQIILEIEKPGGEIWELEIEKDEFEDIGLSFERPLMDEMKTCENKCVFCFIDQLPKNLRGSLYVKDDDPRLSFLTGSYVTLTNLSEREINRITKRRLSPVRISAHAASPELRAMMTGNANAGGLFGILDEFKKAGIEMHFQIVLCRGINDGAALDETIETLLRYKPNAASLSVVPVGLTKHRENLFKLEPYNKSEAARIIKQIEHRQRECLEKYGSRFVFAADEFYLKAETTPPPVGHYEDYPQLENGVGMYSLFEFEFMKALDKTQTIDSNKKIIFGIATGRAAFGLMRGLSDAFAKKFSSAEIIVYKIENDFFGSEITVSGLLTGGDIISQVGNKAERDGVSVLFVPGNAFRERRYKNERRIMLDGTTPGQLKKALNAPVKVGSPDGGKFLTQLVKSFRSLVVP